MDGKGWRGIRIEGLDGHNDNHHSNNDDDDDDDDDDKEKGGGGDSHLVLTECQTYCVLCFTFTTSSSPTATPRRGHQYQPLFSQEETET